MPATLQAYINYTNTQLKAIGDIYFDGLYDSALSLHNWLDAEGNPNSADVVLAMRNRWWGLRNKYDSIIGAYRIQLIGTLQWINDNWPTNGAEVTMDTILSAMVGANFEQLQYFIGLVDAYRVALWNAPFNAEFYAALARGFQQWP